MTATTVSELLEGPGASPDWHHGHPVAHPPPDRWARPLDGPLNRVGHLPRDPARPRQAGRHKRITATDDDRGFWYMVRTEEYIVPAKPAALSARYLWGHYAGKTAFVACRLDGNAYHGTQESTCHARSGTRALRARRQVAGRAFGPHTSVSCPGGAPACRSSMQGTMMLIDATPTPPTESATSEPADTATTVILPDRPRGRVEAMAERLHRRLRGRVVPNR